MEYQTLPDMLQTKYGVFFLKFTEKVKTEKKYYYSSDHGPLFSGGLKTQEKLLSLINTLK